MVEVTIPFITCLPVYSKNCRSSVAVIVIGESRGTCEVLETQGFNDSARRLAPWSAQRQHGP